MTEVTSARPLELADVAEELTIEHVVDVPTGRVVAAREILCQPEFRVSKLRSELVDATYAAIERADGANHRYRCATCGEPVRILGAMRGKRVYFFQHAHKDVHCPLTLEQAGREAINALRFQGQPEGWRHRRMKRLLYASLKADPSFTDVKLETYWPPPAGIERGRTPDLQARRGDRSLALECQISNTSSLDIAGRNRFYRAAGAVMTWFTDFVPAEGRRLYLKDLGETHHGNLFVVDEETAAESARQGEFLVRCHYAEPAIEGDAVVERERQVVVPFAALQAQDGVSFHFDTAGARERLWAEHERVHAARQPSIARAPAAPPPPARAQAPREDGLDKVVAALFARNLPQEHPRVALAELLALIPRGFGIDARRTRAAHHHARERLASLGFTLPIVRSPEFRVLERRATALLSAELGFPIGYEFKVLVQVAHRIADAHRPALTAFLHVSRAFGTEQLLLDQDHEGKWRAKVEDLKRSATYRESAPAVWKPYEPEPWWRSFCAAAYPEVRAFHRHAGEAPPAR